MTAGSTADEWRAHDSGAPPLRRAACPHVLSGAEIGNEVVRRVVDAILDRASLVGGSRLKEIVNETIDTEQARLAHVGTNDPRAATDRAFVAALRHDLVQADDEMEHELVYRIVDRYAKEISGNFDPRVYSVATTLVPGALGLLLHSLVDAGENDVFDLDDRILIEGEVGALRSLVDVGTIILAPTHVSNLDSLILGYALDRLGLPPFAYGAGLNLFTNPLTGFFMRNLGAYTVDRKKRDPLYRQTLKEYSTVLLERGQHSLFFPGGTRSRSGLVETNLKKGLLGTAPVAFRRALASGRPRPRVFVVPCALSYPLVLEAASLVEDWLRAEGGADYADLADEFGHPHRWLDFLRSLFVLDLRIHVRFGRPLDVVGNEVDDNGISHDSRGQEIDPAGYFTVDGELCPDEARDAEYTRTLASRIAGAYRRETVALPTSVLAYAVFDRIRRESGETDLFRLLRAIGPRAGVAAQDVIADVARMVVEIRALEQHGALRAASELTRETPSVIVTQALATFATYHHVPVLAQHGDRLRVGDANLLFYYRNRLEGYDLLADRRAS